MKPKKPTNPTSPKGVKRSGAGRRGRGVGTSVQYTPEQTARYKSQALRYSKAVELAAGGADFVQTKDGMQLSTDVIKGKGRDVFELSDRLLFKYSSDRAPKDYWTVTVEGKRLELEGDVQVTGAPPASATWNFEHPDFTFTASGLRQSQPAQPGSIMNPLPPPPALPRASPAPSGATSRIWQLDLVDYKGPTFQYRDGIKVQVAPPQFVVLDPFLIFDSVAEAGYDLTITTEISDATYYNFFVDLIRNNFRAVNRIGPYYGPIDLPPEAIPTEGESIAFTEYSYFTYTLTLVSGTPPPAGSPQPPYVYNPGIPPVAGAPGAFAGGEWYSNVLTFNEPQIVTIAADYTIQFASSTASSIEYRYDGVTAGMLLLPGGAAGLKHEEWVLELPKDVEVQFFIHLLLETHLNAATIVLDVGTADLEIKCDCPDYTKTIGTLPRSTFNSERVDRDWTGSAAGCDQEQGCKHVIATKLHVGLPVDAPTDYPL